MHRYHRHNICALASLTSSCHCRPCRCRTCRSRSRTRPCVCSCVRVCACASEKRRSTSAAAVTTSSSDEWRIARLWAVIVGDCRPLRGYVHSWRVRLLLSTRPRLLSPRRRRRCCAHEDGVRARSAPAGVCCVCARACVSRSCRCSARRPAPPRRAHGCARATCARLRLLLRLAPSPASRRRRRRRRRPRKTRARERDRCTRAVKRGAERAEATRWGKATRACAPPRAAPSLRIRAGRRLARRAPFAAAVVAVDANAG